jgi:Lon protease-like protein
MKKTSPFAQSFDQLPSSLPIFPLSNAIVLPGGHLPLNIFEPRYLNMFKDVMKDAQLIGMIQPKDSQPQGSETPPPLFDVGCAARVTRYEETSDGRLEVMLTGLCRFSVQKEIPSIRGYRVIVPDWASYELDYDGSESVSQENRMLLNGSLRQYFTYKNLDVDWGSFSQVSTETLLNNLIAQLALAPEDKQILIETPDLANRVKSFCALLEVEKMSNEQAH